MNRAIVWSAALTLGSLFGPAASGAEVAADADALAKALSNPVAALISVPLQLNYDDGYELGGERFTLNIQPVVPIGISEHWNMISRTILPVIEQSDVVNGDSQFGLGDTVQSLFFSPKAPTKSGWIWGVGPAFMLPTATDDLLGSEKWSIGPTAVVLKQTESGWTYGALANHLWSVAGDDNRGDVNATFLQPFLSKGLGHGRTATVNFESTYDWEGEQWTVRVNFMYSKVTKIGGQMVSFAGGARAYLDAPENGPDWGLRFVVTLLFPK
jgi:Putative MetA-pathway of phenol degradation